MKSKFDMYYGASTEILEKAKILRKSETNAEKILWERLRNKQVLGLKFRRQHPIDIFIVDFYCHQIKLVVEVDGKIHLKLENREYDQNREEELRNYGIKIIRFTNQEIKKDVNNVIKRIIMYIEEYCLY